MEVSNTNRFRNWFASGAKWLAGLSGPVYAHIRTLRAYT